MSFVSSRISPVGLSITGFSSHYRLSFSIPIPFSYSHYLLRGSQWDNNTRLTSTDRGYCEVWRITEDINDTSKNWSSRDKNIWPILTWQSKFNGNVPRDKFGGFEINENQPRSIHVLTHTYSFSTETLQNVWPLFASENDMKKKESMWDTKQLTIRCPVLDG